MSFNLKPKNQGGSNSVDWEAIYEQVEEGTQAGIISLIIDLGEQAGTEKVSDTDSDNNPAATVVSTEEEANALITKATEVMSKYKDKKATKVSEGYSVPFKIYTTKDCQQVAVFVDFPETMVDYGDGVPKPYRVMLNPNFKGNIAGFDLKASPPKGKGNKLWTFATNSKLYKLAQATRTPEIISEGEENMNIGLLLGKSALFNIRKKDGFISVDGNGTPLMKGMVVPKLSIPCVGISFDNVTVELLEKAGIRKGIIEKIKTALNYNKTEGSKMRSAIEELDKKYQSKRDTGKDTQNATEEAVELENDLVENQDLDDDPF